MDALRNAIRECNAPLEIEGYPGCFRLRGADGIREHLAGRGMFSSGWVIPSAAHEPQHYALMTEALIQFIRK